ncbi:ROK family protein [Chitinophaga sp. Hz27]|uniref:ROK family protein n=1 Tax=Chitinophaga sp. Hz27 TaxID=3347169 RepID=UPI0035E34385
MKDQFKIGLDVGGSHITAALLENDRQLYVERTSLNSNDAAFKICSDIQAAVACLLEKESRVSTVGIAFPGPFNYPKGVSTISGVGSKFEKTFGLHMKAALQASFDNKIAFHFANDAHCFAIGCYNSLQRTSPRSIFLTLGTGFGSAFFEQDQLLHHHPSIPANAAFYDQPFKASIADDYFSTRWFLQEYEMLTSSHISSVKQLVEEHNTEAVIIFERFADNLSAFIIPWLKKFECAVLVIGGSIARANHLFAGQLQQYFNDNNCTTEIIFTDDTEQMIINGAAIMAEDNGYHKYFGQMESINLQLSADITSYRKTNQPLLPINKTAVPGYDMFPAFQLAEGQVHTGFDTLAAYIRTHKNLVIDGYGGVLWEPFRQQLNAALLSQGVRAFWYDIESCLKSEAAVDLMVNASLNGEDPVFGKKFTGALVDFFDQEKLHLLQPDGNADINIVYGSGAALSGWDAPIIYLDVPKNEIQYRMRAGSITNLGTGARYPLTQTYKRFYFVDWPVLNMHKAQLLHKMAAIVDEQRIHHISWMSGEDFRNALHAVVAQPFRARPWFEAGIWGGNWMKQHLDGLQQQEVNYAWSFELITPENGIVLESDNNLLEISFDYLLYQDNEKVLGKAAKRFGTEFPIRFDFLDTFDGGNLSIQCHPRVAYIRENFGENFTQDETYYIMDCKPDAQVYLGFTENINPAEFKQALIAAQEQGKALPVSDYIQVFDAKKHDLFLIPNGTVHASGKNNLVLEISSTPYIFTFKMYDWLRPGLDGKPRPINIEHAFNNLYFDRKGDYVPTNLISHPQVVTEWNEGRKLQLPTHPEHFYTVDRYEFSGDITIATNGQCHICMLVEGSEIEVVVDKKSTVFRYAETFVVPAAVTSYTVRNKGTEKAFLVSAYVKDECC